MANNIDERIVELQFDNKQFESGVRDTIKSLDDLKKGLKLEDVTEGFAALDKAAAGVNLNPLQNGVEQISQKFSALEIVAISALNRITNQVMATGETFVKSLTISPIASGWDKYEQKVASVQKIMNSQADLTMDQVEAALDKINWFTDETSYDFSAMVQTLGSFASAGIELEDSTELIIGLGNAAAISGVNAKDANHAFLGFQRAIGSGYLSLGLWNSFLKTAGFQSQKFVNAAIRAGLEVGTLKGDFEHCTTAIKGTTVNLGTFSNTLNEKWLNQDVLKRLAKNFNLATNELYDIMNPPDGSDSKYRSLNEAIQTIGDTLDQESLAALQAGQETKTWADTVEYVRESVTQGWSQTFELIFGNYKEATKFFSTIVEEMGKLFVEGGTKRNEFLAKWKELGGRNSFINGLINSARILNTIISNIKEAFAKVIPPVAVESAVKLTAAFERATVSIAEALGITNIADSFKQEIEEVAEGLNDTAEAGEGVAGTLKTIAEMANLVIRGDFGNGEARRTALENLGYSYETVQNKVNELLGCSFRYDAMSEEEADSAMKLANANNDAAESFEEEGKVVVDVNNTILNLSSTFKGIVAIAEIFAYAIGSIARVAARVFKYVFKLGDGFLGLTGSLGDLLVTVKDFIIENDIFFTILNGIADVIGLVLTPIINTFTSVMDALASRANPISDFLSTIIDGITSLSEIDIAPIFKQTFDTISVSVQNFVQQLSTSVQNVISFVSKIEIVKTVVSLLGGAFLGVSTAVHTLWNTLKKGPTAVFNNIKGFYDKTVEWVKSVEFPSLNLNFDTFVQTIKDFGKNDIIAPAIKAFQFISEKVKELGDHLVEGGKKALSFVRENNVLEMALQGLLLVIMAIPLAIIKIWDVVKDAPITVFNEVKKFFEQIGTQLQDLELPDIRTQFQDLWKTISGTVTNTVIPGVSNAFSNMSGSLGDFIVQIAKGIGAVAKFIDETDILGITFRFFEPYVKDISNRLKNLWTSISTSAPQIRTTLENVFGTLSGWFNKFELSRLQWNFDDFWRKFLPSDSFLVKLNDFKRDGFKTLFSGVGVFKDVGREMVAYYDAVAGIISDYAKNNKFLDAIGKALTFIKNGVVFVFNYLSAKAAPTIDKIQTALKPVTDRLSKFWKFLSSIDYQAIFKYAGAIAAIAGAFMMLKTVYNVSRFLSGFASIGDAISDFCNAIRIKAIGQAALDFALAVGIICGVAYMVSKLTWDEVIRGFVAVGIIAGLMVGAMFAFSSIAKRDPKAIFAAITAIGAIALAIGAVVASMVFLKDMSQDDYIKALKRTIIIIGMLSLVMLGLSYLTKDKVLDWKSMVALYMFSMTMSKVVSLMKDIADMDLTGMAKSLGALLVVAIIIGIIAESANGLKFGNTFSLLVMAGTLWLFTQVVKGFANEDFERMTVGLLKMIPMIVALQIIAGMGKKVGNGGLQMAALLIGFAISIKMIAKVIAELGRLPVEELRKGGIAVAAIMTALVISAHFLSKSSSALGFFKKAQGGSVGAILAFSVAVLACAYAVKILSEIKDTKKALLCAGALGLIILALGKAMNWAFVFSNGKSIASILAFIAVIVTLVGALAVMQFLDTEKLKTNALALGGLIVAVGAAVFGTSFVSVKSLVALLEVAGLIVLIVAELKSLESVGNIKEIADALTEVLGIVSVLGLVIGAVSALNQGPALATAAHIAGTGVGIGAAIGAIETILVGVTGLLAKCVFGGKDHDLNAGLDEMVKIFEKIGEMVGSVGGGTIAGYANSLGDSGKKLSQFADDAESFSTTIAGTKWGDYTSNLVGFSNCIKALNSVKPDPDKFNKISGIMFSLGTGAKNLMSSLEIAHFNFDKFDEFATALPKIVELVQNPIHFGETYWDNFSEGMTNLGNAVVDFSKIVNGDNKIDPTGFANAQSAVSKLVGIAEQIKGLGTFYGFDTILGEVDANGENSLVRLAKSLKKFTEEFGIDGDEGAVDVDRMYSIIEGVRRLAVAAKNVPMSEITDLGTNFGMNILGQSIDFGFNDNSGKEFSWETLSNGLEGLATAIVTFSTTSKGIDDDGFSTGLSAVEQLADVAQRLPVSFTSDLKKFIFEDDKSVGGFAKAIENLASAIYTFHEKLHDLDSRELDPCFTLLNRILSLPASFTRAGLGLLGGIGVSDSLSIFGDALVNFASQFSQACNILHEAAVSLNDPEQEKGSTLADEMGTLFNGLFSFLNEDNLAQIEAAGQLISQHLSTGVNSDTTYVVAAVSQYLVNFVHELESDVAVNALYQSGLKLSENLCKGFNGKEARGNIAPKAVIPIAEKIKFEFYTKTVYDMMYAAGSHLVDGLIKGMTDRAGDVKTAAAGLAEAANTGFTTAEKVNSPSKVWIKFGGSLIEGLVKGINHDSYLAENSVEELASNINSVMGDASITPTITPVVDLNDATISASRINTMFDASRAAALNASMEINSQVSQMDDLIDMTSRIFGAIQNGSDLYLDDNILAGRINRRLGML